MACSLLHLLEAMLRNDEGDQRLLGLLADLEGRGFIGMRNLEFQRALA
jgi:hypothetical protein